MIFYAKANKHREHSQKKIDRKQTMVMRKTSSSASCTASLDQQVTVKASPASIKGSEEMRDLLAAMQLEGLSDERDLDPSFTFAQCRFCLLMSEKDHLLSPCACTGTIKYVHGSCLAKWRATLFRQTFRLLGQRYDFSPDHCPVCREKFVLPKEELNTRHQDDDNNKDNDNDGGYSSSGFIIMMTNLLPPLFGFYFVSLLVLGLSGPPWPHLVMLVATVALAFLGNRSYALSLIALLVFSLLTFAALHAQGLMLVMQMSPRGRLTFGILRANSENSHASEVLKGEHSSQITSYGANFTALLKAIFFHEDKG